MPGSSTTSSWSRGTAAPGSRNLAIQRAGLDFRLALPSQRFRRSIGSWANVATDPQGNPISRGEYDRRLPEWLPSEADRAFVRSVMQRVVEPGTFTIHAGADSVTLKSAKLTVTP